MSTREELSDLLARCALNDHRAFEQLYQFTSAKLYGLVVRIVREEQLARDVLQDGYVRIWDHAQDYRPDRASPITWMGSIMRNRAIDLVRRKKSNPLGEASDDELRWLEDDKSVPPDRQVDFDRQRRILQDCLEVLSDDQRQAIVLAYYRGLTHEELAHYLDKPLGTVKSWLRRGLLKLKDCLDRS